MQELGQQFENFGEILVCVADCFEHREDQRSAIVWSQFVSLLAADVRRSSFVERKGNRREGLT